MNVDEKGKELKQLGRTLETLMKYYRYNSLHMYYKIYYPKKKP